VTMHVFVVAGSPSSTNRYMPDAPPKPHPVSLRLPPDVKEAAERAAKDDTRSLSSLIQRVLVEHLKAKGYLG
jgi:hypothetical protein